MKILFISQYYLPQPLANAEVIGALATALGAAGHEVTVISPVRDAPTGGGVAHRRAFGTFARDRGSIPERLVEYATFSAGALVAGWKAPRPDVVVVPSPPLTLGVVGRLVAGRHRRPLVYNVQDLYPEITDATGGTPGWARRAMLLIARWIYRSSAAVVVIDPSFLPVIRNGCAEATVMPVRNGIDRAPFASAARSAAFLSSVGADVDRPVVMYAGNVGRSQDLLAVAEATEAAGATFIVHGGGAGLHDLQSAVTDRNMHHVRFSAYSDRSRLGEIYASADLHVVPLKPGVARASVPSKLLSIFSAGRPAVLAAERHSAAAEILAEADGGWLVEPGDPAQLRDAIVSALDDPAAISERGRSAAAWATVEAGHDRMASEWSEVLRDVTRRDAEAAEQRTAASPLRTTAKVLRFVWTHPANRGQRVSSLGRAARYQIAGRLGHVTEAALGTRSVIRVRHGSNSAAAALYANPPDFAEMSCWARHLEPGDLFVDVGANVGVYSIWAADLGAEVIAIEPITPAADELLANFALNGYEVELHRVGLADAPGIARMTTDDGTMNRLATDMRSDTVEITVDTLDRILHGRSVAGVKIDVEGAERLVLDGARESLRAHRIGMLQIEWNDRSQSLLGEDRSPVASLLSHYGYGLFRPTESGDLVGVTSVDEGADMFAIPLREG